MASPSTGAQAKGMKKCAALGRIFSAGRGKFPVSASPDDSPGGRKRARENEGLNSPRSGPRLATGQFVGRLTSPR